MAPADPQTAVAVFANLPLEGWVQLELLGHRQGHGHLTVVPVAPFPLESRDVVFRFEVPAVEDKPAETHFYSPQAVYGIHPSTEAAVIEALTPFRYCHELIEDESGFDKCSLRAGHEGEHEGLPF